MEQQDEGMSLVEHLTELRKRVIWVIAVLIVGMVIGLIFAQPLIIYFKTVPPANTINWNVFSPGDSLRMYMNFGLLVGLIVTLPVAMYHLWAFLKPGLRVEEQKASLMFVPFAFLLFLIGLAFGYFVVFRMAFIFTSSISKNLQLTETYGISQYFSFMFNIIIPLSLLFELPIVAMFLTKLRILNPMLMRKLRRYAYLLLVIVAAVITPPDATSMILVFLPMIVLYEFSTFLSGFIYRRQLIRDKEWEDDKS
ncbi:twin-arginine translocase subunit TatC [Paenibacillus thalictri]|uniref:Sec-independent protein translocase protein TatC n=1 Tax=Paenibacillus thalictri TaxID=2527873 RepID=A0A4V2J2Y0_9BACL|nr:twin-arginine translocase subunit TatC [Paenibacillus thalictri]TBL67760.1 twin-arginine translocase subunit TatC [Paenibacillus thalictri]